MKVDRVDLIIAQMDLVRSFATSNSQRRSPVRPARSAQASVTTASASVAA